MIIDGKHQKLWFKLFNLIDKINEVSPLNVNITECAIKNFTFTNRNSPEGSLIRELAMMCGKRQKK